MGHGLKSDGRSTRYIRVTGSSLYPVRHPDLLGGSRHRYTEHRRRIGSSSRRGSASSRIASVPRLEELLEILRRVELIPLAPELLDLIEDGV
jgi:hypothetical protein